MPIYRFLLSSLFYSSQYSFKIQKKIIYSQSMMDKPYEQTLLPLKAISMIFLVEIIKLWLSEQLL